MRTETEVWNKLAELTEEYDLVYASGDGHKAHHLSMQRHLLMWVLNARPAKVDEGP